jgi:signal transduction histidine kinase
LKYTGRYRLLSFVSIQNLLFAILWGCYFYGGLSSPFLPWLVTVPLLAFFYVGATVVTASVTMLQIGVSIGLFIAAYRLGELPHTIALIRLQGIGLVSIISASIYVSMMALYYARILASQSEFECEVSKHLVTADQLREATTQAERASAAKAEFLARMTHELRTPLNAVIGYSQMLLEETDPAADPQGVEDLNKIHSAGGHLLELINAILDLSKIEAGRMEAFPETLDVASLCEKLRQRWSRDPRFSARPLRAHVDPGVGSVLADPVRIEQVLDALIGNAARYAPNSACEIHARPAAIGDAVEISVVDHGPGIPPGLLPTLFETFHDSEDLSSGKSGGAGLGLPLSYRLCALMHAALDVHSSPASGTKVTVALPRRGPQNARHEEAQMQLAKAA